MPVVVTGASGLVGRALVARLLDRGGEVRAYVRRPDAAEELRRAGAKAAVGRALDVETLALVMTEAHTVCHLVGGLDVDEKAYEGVNLEPTLAAIEAATEAGVARFLYLSYPGADPASPNRYLRAKGTAEDAVRSSGMESVVLRATHVYGPGSTWLREMRRAAGRRPLATVVGSGRQRLAPVALWDVAEVLAAADDRARETGGTFALQGPDVVTADELVDLLAGRTRRKAHLSPEAAARASRLLGRRAPVTMLEVLAADSLADAPDAAAEFGIRPTPLAEGLVATDG